MDAVGRTLPSQLTQNVQERQGVGPAGNTHYEPSGQQITFEVVALSGSRRTESLWVRTSVFELNAEAPIAAMLLNLAIIKESYAPYSQEYKQLYS